MANPSPEKLKLGEVSSEKARTAPEKKRAEAEKVKRETEEILSAEGVENVENQEGVEFSEGKVGEVVREDKTQAPQASGKRAYTADEIETIRAQLLKALPTQEIMIKQIRKKLYAQEKVLTHRMKKLRKKAHFNAFQLTIVVAQLRKIREYFSMLAHTTYEMVKHLWLKIVHGI